MSDLIPEGWSLKYVSEAANNFDGKRVALKSTDRATKQGQYRYYGASNVIDHVDDYIFNGDYILLGEDGENVLSRNLPLAFIVKGKFWVNNHAHVLQPKNDIDIGYLCEVLEAFDYKNIASGSAQPKITQGALNKVSLLFPPLPEQQKIAAILTSVDEVIEKKQAQCDKLKDLKTAMMQTLLTKGVGIDGNPHTEFKDSPVGRIPKGWEVVKVNQLVNVMESGWSPQCETDKGLTGEWCVLKTTAVSWTGFNSSANKKLPSSLEPRENIQVKPNDILITRAGPADRVGVVVYVNNVPSKVMLSDKIIRIQTNKRCDSEFLSMWLSSTFAQHFMASRVSGLASSQTNISQSILSSIPCILPSLEEQNIIVKTIRSINDREKKQTIKLSSQKQIKKALMQDLLTGKVRVTVPTSSSAKAS